MTDPGQSKSTGRAWRIIRLILIYIIGGFILAETFYRLFWEEPPLAYIIPGNHPVYHHVPDAFVKGGMDRFDYRGREYTVDKEPGVLRIVFMGDSFTWGIVEHGQTIPAYFKQYMEERYPGVRLEVLNFGFPSYSPVIQEVQYRNIVRHLHADWIVYLYDSCDPIDDQIYTRFALFDKTGRPTAVRNNAAYNTGLRHSKFYRFIEYAATVIANDGHYLPQEERQANRGLYLTDPGATRMFRQWIDLSFGYVTQMINDMRDDGSSVVLFHYPWPFHLRDTSEFKEFFMSWGVPDGKWVTPEQHKFGLMLLDFCKRMDLECHDFSPEIRKLEEDLDGGSRLKLYNNKNGHFTAFTNQAFARYMVGYIGQRLASQAGVSGAKVKEASKPAP